MTGVKHFPSVEEMFEAKFKDGENIYIRKWDIYGNELKQNQQ